MIKNKMVKLVGSAMASALMFGTVVPTNIYANENESKSEVSQKQEYNQELVYAIEEMRIAIDLLDNADLTDVNNYDRMMAFTNAAQQRVEAMESNEYVDDVYRLVKEVHQGSEVALRMIYDIDSLKTTFDNKAADKEKDARIDALNEAVIYARENNVTNNATINSATKLLHQYANLMK